MSKYNHPYPNSSPEFRFLKKPDGSVVLQVRYVCPPQGYTSSWADIPVVEDQVKEVENV